MDHSLRTTGWLERTGSDHPRLFPTADYLVAVITLGGVPCFKEGWEGGARPGGEGKQE